MEYESDRKNPPVSFKLKVPVIVVLFFGNYYLFSFVYRNEGRMETNLILL